jgi:GMP synthase (glutamine-hydrolysing)
MKIGILQTGRALDELAERHGDFDSLFMQLLVEQGFDFEVFAVLDFVFPSSVTECDGWLVTGSRFSSYEPLPWIAQLEEFLRVAYDQDVPIVGICFGHQVMARALGGVVEKYAGGWSVGPHEYQFDGIDRPVVINAWHQDQVVVLPEGARSVGRSDFCANAAIVYDGRAYTVQAHPEFHNDFISDLIVKRRASIPAELAVAAEARLKNFAPSPEVMAQIVSFFKTRSLVIKKEEQAGTV